MYNDLTLCERVRRPWLGTRPPAPTAAQWAATYSTPDPMLDAEADRLRAAAARWRRDGDHIAAGALECDAATVERMAHHKRAYALALREACGCASCAPTPAGSR